MATRSMQPKDDTQQSAELRQAFLRHLPQRLERVQRRGMRLCQGGWDINALSVLMQEVQTLAGASGRYGLLDTGEHLYSIEVFLVQFAEGHSIPDATQSAKFQVLLSELSPLIEQHRENFSTLLEEQHTSAVAVDNISVPGVPLMVTPPPEYWRRWAKEPAPQAAPKPSAAAAATAPAPAPTESPSAKLLRGGAGITTVPRRPLGKAQTPTQAPAAAKAPVAVTAPAVAPVAAPARGAEAATAAQPAALPTRATEIAKATTSATVAEPARAPAPLRPAAAARSAATVAPSQTRRTIYHLSDGNSLACEIDQRLELQGHELTLLESPSELTEMLATFAPNLVLVDAPFLEELTRIGEVITAARARLNRRLSLVAFSDSADLSVRLRAMRAGADAFIAVPTPAHEVLSRVGELLEGDASDPFRVLIIEDDRSQAMFAESILRKTGMETRAVMDPLAALDTLDEFHPDLILMDLYMPNCDGMELTAIIREREAFVSTPIVFLSGEQDQEKHFEALDAGGDDFLSKPIRPKHLISAVNNRLRRARAQSRRQVSANPRDSVSGLYDRGHVLDRLSASLATEDDKDLKGGILYVDVDGSQPIRERLGLTGFDGMLGQIGALIASRLADRDQATRYGDTSFLILAFDKDESQLEQLGERLRQQIAAQTFDLAERNLSVTVSVGVCGFAVGLGEAGAMLNAAERASSEARNQGGNRVRRHFAPLRAAAGAAVVEEGLGEVLREALVNDNFHLLFQPIVSLHGGEEEQFQALLRLRSSGGKLVPASQIVPVALREGLIGEVDRWVISRCLLVLSERHRQNRPARMFVSQSVASAQDPECAAWLKQVLETRRIPGAQLVLEFQLSEVLAKLREMVVFAQALKGLGVRLALSGFEANLTAFQIIQYLPVDFIKIAAKYTTTEARQGPLRDELQQIVRFARERNKKVIAPRIEDASSAAALWGTGVDLIQGNFVQQPGQDLDFDFRSAAL